MTTVRISDVTKHEGYVTAIVTADGRDPVRVDNFTGAWTFPHDPEMPPTARCARRVVLGWCVELLNAAVKTGEPQHTAIATARETPVLRPKTTPTTPDQIAQAMAKAAANAVREAA